MESVATDGGIRIDFISGVRITIPAHTPEFRYKISDAANGELYDTGCIAGDEAISYLYTKRKYFTLWKIELYRKGRRFFSHTFNAGGKKVFVDLSCGALGDSVAWLPAAVAFQRKWLCRLIVCMKPEHIPLYEKVYPEIRFLPKSPEAGDIATQCYAYYRVAVFGYGNIDRELMDFRQNNLVRHADMILGVDSGMTPPLVAGAEDFVLPEVVRGKRYVCIAARASRKCKEWNNPNGWNAVVAALRQRGFKVICIDSDNLNLPPNTVDLTGFMPLPERVEILRKAEFFIGLPSGLSWLAWACQIPVIMISGITDDYVEFPTPYRIAPPAGVCHGCWQSADQRQRALFADCYYGRNNECTRKITPQMVIREIDRLMKKEDHLRYTL